MDIVVHGCPCRRVTRFAALRLDYERPQKLVCDKPVDPSIPEVKQGCATATCHELKQQQTRLVAGARQREAACLLSRTNVFPILALAIH